MRLAGYLHRRYADSLAEFGTPQQLVHCGGWLLRRHIPGTPYSDAMGCYPLFLCRDWNELGQDLRELDDQLVTIALVADPFGEYTKEGLRHCFPDVLFHYKDHFVVDLSKPIRQYISPHHHRNARKAMDSLEVRVCEFTGDKLAAWCSLYEVLVKRHDVRGITAFSQDAFAAQSQVPGLVGFEAVHGEQSVGMLLWYLDETVCYYHLGAFNETGYRLGASFALFRYAIEYFADVGTRWLDLGAGAGVNNSANGLTRFKRGWATGTRPAYFCGRVLNPTAYKEVNDSRGRSNDAEYFPAYRKGEFA